MLTPVIRSLELALLPVEALAIEADCYVVIDVLRATTTIATLFAAGLHDLVVADDVERARGLAREQSRLLFGEVGGLPPAGFDHGNSPVEAARARVQGRGAVLFTTNGTVALCALAGRGNVFAGALANAGVIAERMAGYERAVVVCAGEENGKRFAGEDFVAAGAIIERAVALAPHSELGDAARLAQTAWDGGEGAALIASSRHGRALAAIGLATDIDFALRQDTSLAVPTVCAWGEGWALLEDRADRAKA